MILLVSQVLDQSMLPMKREKPDERTHEIIADFKAANLNPTLTTNFGDFDDQGCL